MKYGCCVGLEQYEWVKAAGFENIVLSAVEVAEMEEQELLLLKRKMEEDHITCTALNAFCSSELKLCGEGYQIKAAEEYGKNLMCRAAALGIRKIGIGSPKSRMISSTKEYPAALEQFKTSLELFCKEAAKWNIEILLEAVCTVKCNFISTTGEAWKIVEDLRKKRQMPVIPGLLLRGEKPQEQ